MSDSKARILVVDDTLANQEICAIMLDELNYSCDIASNGKEAIDLFLINKYDLVLMDSKMPVMDGIESIRQIRIIEQQSNDIEQHLHTPIVLVSANTDISILNDAKIDGVLQKPFTMEQLECVCRQHLFPHGEPEIDSSINTNDEKQKNEYGIIDERRYLDRETFEQLCSITRKNNSDLLINMVNRFVEQTPREIKEIRVLFENNDIEKMAAQIHELGSWCSFLGTARVVNVCKKLESMVRKKNLDSVGTVLSGLEEEVRIASDILADKLLKEDIPNSE